MLNIFINGGPVMYPLLACSIIVLTVILERIYFWINLNKNQNHQLVDEVLELCRKGDWDSVKGKTAGSKDYIIKILITGILHRDFSMIKAMESSAAEEIKRMRRYMNILDTMITVAPLLGIFGTVIGIILSFEVLGSSGIEHPEAVTAGIAQALITTATGLGIAILTVFPYNYFNFPLKNMPPALRLFMKNLFSLQQTSQGICNEAQTIQN
jgi:biopolymer transport protein ExbB